MATPRRGPLFVRLPLPWIVGALVVGIPGSSAAQSGVAPPTGAEAVSVVDDPEPSVVVELRSGVPYDFGLLFPPVSPRALPPDSFRQQEARPGNFVFGAIVGALVGAYIAQQTDTYEDEILYVPLGALIGGVVFWTSGFRVPTRR